METALSIIDKASSRQLEIMRKARRGGNVDPSTIFQDAGGFGSLGFQNQDIYTTEMAYTHNRGEPYAATRPISQRVAGQPIHVAEVVNAKPATKSFEKPKHGRRRLTPVEMAKLPRWVRHRLQLTTSENLGDCVKSMHSASIRVDILEQHPVLDLLAQPNPRMNGMTLIELTIVSLMFTGRCYWWIWDGVKDRPYDLFYLPAHRVREQPDNVLLDKGYMVAPPSHVGGPDIPIPAKWMIYFYHPDPSDPMRALAPIRACMQNVRVGEAITTSQESTFNNGLYPGLAVITGDIIAPDKTNLGKAQLETFQRNEIRTRLEQFHRSPMKHNRVLIMDRAIDDIKFLNGLKPHEMSWLESSEYNRDCIWRVVGTPRVIAGDINDANRATALVADEAFIGNVLNPRTTMLSHVMNDQLLPLYNTNNEDLIMWIEECISADRDMRLKELDLMVKNRAIIIDDMRSELGEPPLPNDKGKVLKSLATDIYEPLDDNDDDVVAYREEVIEDQAAAGKPPSGGKPPKEEKPKQTPPPSADATATGKSFESKDYADIWLKIHARQERPFVADVKRFLDAQVKHIVSQIDNQQEPLFNPREWDKGLIKVASPHLKMAAMTGAQNMLNQSANLRSYKADDVTIEMPQEVLQAIQDYLREVVQMRYWREINDTTGERLATQIQASLQAGESITQRAQRVKTALGTQSGPRALMIARSETSGSLNAGSMAVIKDLMDQGLATGAAWLATDDAHVRPTHWEANGQEQDDQGYFTVGGHKGQFPGDPAFPPEERCNCRCTITSVLVKPDRSARPSVKSLLIGPGQLFERIERRFIVDNIAPIVEQLLEHGKIREYGIKTLYLDHRIPTWSLRRGNGVKFRLRRYDTGETFFEQKVKQDGVTYKKRRKTTLTEVGHDLIPIGLASYTRTEFEQNGSRVTVDRDVLLNGKTFGKFIVEVKGKMPEWLNLSAGSEQTDFSKSSAILNHE